MVTDNDEEQSRNALPVNLERIRRAKMVLGGAIERAFDFGCGTGFLVSLLESHEIKAEGINYETRALIDYLPNDFYDVIFMIEVIEHLTNPREIFEKLADSLKPGGVLMIETTFADQIYDPNSSSYVDPKIGHVNVISRAGLPRILPPSLKVSHWMNRNVCVLRKG
jgi:SAM-dependent methyltransferase